MHNDLTQRFCAACESSDTTELSTILADDFKGRLQNQATTFNKQQLIDAVQANGLVVDPSLITVDVKGDKIRSILAQPDSPFTDLFSQATTPPLVGVSTEGSGSYGAGTPGAAGGGYKPTSSGSNPGKYTVPGTSASGGGSGMGKGPQAEQWKGGQGKEGVNRPNRPARREDKDVEETKSSAQQPAEGESEERNQ